jgi:hypothetical protein
MVPCMRATWLRSAVVPTCEPAAVHGASLQLRPGRCCGLLGPPRRDYNVKASQSTPSGSCQMHNTMHLMSKVACKWLSIYGTNGTQDSVHNCRILLVAAATHLTHVDLHAVTHGAQFSGSGFVVISHIRRPKTGAPYKQDSRRCNRHRQYQGSNSCQQRDSKRSQQ